MSPEQLDAARVRLMVLQAASGAMEAAWPYLTPMLQGLRAEKVEALVSADDQELRGRIKQIDDLLQMPQYLRSEIQVLSEALSEPDAS